MKVYLVTFGDYNYGVNNYAIDKEWIKRIVINKVNEYNDKDKKNRIIEVSNIDFRKWYWFVKYEHYWWWDFWELLFDFRELTLI